MANRYQNQFSATMEKKVVSLFAKVAFGASGAPTLSAVNSKGVLSVTRNSAGTYTFVFGSNATLPKDVYVKLLSADVIFNSGASAPASPAIYVKSDLSATTAASLQVVLNAAGTATDPASGEIGYFNFIFGDSTAP